MIYIRKMEPTEANYVQKLAKKCFEGIEKFFVSKPKEAMVAVVDNQIVGGIIIKYIITRGHKIGCFDTAFIDPRHQGQGIGSALYEKTTQYLWDEGCTALSGLVKDDNVGSWKLFLNNGFSQTSFFEGVRQIGIETMLVHYFRTPFFISNGMEFYFTAKNGVVSPKENHSVKQVSLYILINALFMLLALTHQGPDVSMFIGAYIVLLLSGVLFGYIGTRFSRRRWHFRLNTCGAMMVAFICLLGGLYPMIGNWYPEKYENTTKFRRDLGIISTCEWIGIICITVVAVIFKTNQLFLSYLAYFGVVLLLYKIITLYPFESYGGRRVYLWHKGIYGGLAIISAFIIISWNFLK